MGARVRPRAPFQREDLEELDSLFARAQAVVAMEDIDTGEDSERVIGLRHDVDNSLEPALNFARWEADRGYRSTYFLLHSAAYWTSGRLEEAVREMSELGHEVGIHNNAIAEHVRTGRDPHEILKEATEQLRSYGVTVVGTVAHGDKLCREREFINDELFEECERFGDELWLGGGPHRIGAIPVERKPLAYHGLEYDSNWLHRPFYASDSGGVWQGEVDRVPHHDFSGQLHILIHPCWWARAF
jgi:hypothetical protein